MEGPPQPQAILRGHAAQVHAARFIRGNERLVTGDAQGFVVVWDLTVMRARAVWRAHQKTILGIEEWGPGRLITHGRDNELIVWKFAASDEDSLSRALPLDGVPDDRPKPWIQHVMPVNAMNFCAFAMVPCKPGIPVSEADEILVSTPNAIHLDGVDIFHLPSQQRIHVLKPLPGAGMPMALSLFHSSGGLHLAAAYENGTAAVLRADLAAGEWTTLYKHQAHGQPVLSLAVSPCRSFFFTSGADAVVAKHPVPKEPEGNGKAAEQGEKEPVSTPLKRVDTKNAGQQSLHVRSDGAIFATAGWDCKVRVYSAKSLKEVAVLKWHQSGCCSVAFAAVDLPQPATQQSTNPSDTQGGGGSAVATRASAPAYYDVKDRRIQHAKTAHWVAVGAKDGKVSLWDIY